MSIVNNLSNTYKGGLIGFVLGLSSIIYYLREMSFIEAFFSTLIISLVITVIGLIVGFLFKTEKERGFKLLSLQGIFYILGWIFGAPNLIFWLYQLVLHHMYNVGSPFITKDFHRRTYKFAYLFFSILLVVEIIKLLI